MSTDNPYISFPSGSVADQPLRVSLLWNTAAGLALNKPAGLAAFQDTRLGGGARSVLTELNNWAAAGSTQCERLGIEKLSLLNLLDREASGILLFTKTHQARADLKNAMGSSQFTFRYRFLTAAQCSEETIVCELPVAVHRQKSLALISNRTGKKTVTTFRRLEDFGGCSLWETESEYDRFHQVRLHAAESGLPILGDSLYCHARGEDPPPVPAKVKAILPGEGLLLHLFSMTFPCEGAPVELEGAYPGSFRMVMKKLARI